MKQFTITYRGKFGATFALVVGADSETEAKQSILDRYLGVTILTCRENNPPLATVAAVER